MRRLTALLCVLALAACANYGSSGKYVAEFWRPVSERNAQMPDAQAQKKLEFDVSQCNCGIYPSNVTQPDVIAFQPDQQRLMETSLATSQADHGACIQRPSLVVAECMRTRGWEITKCSGRMPVGGTASLCAAAIVDEDQ